MDSITQILLGAAVGEATLGRRVGRKAMLWGGFCGLFPDLDILIPFQDAVKDFTYHRSASHSLFVLALLTPVLVRMIVRLHPQTAVYRNRWYLLVFLALSTHVLLDCFTVYGTQIFWPLATPPVMGSTIFIIDPAYSIPLLAGVLGALLLSRKTTAGWMLNAAGLALSTFYLTWSAGAKIHVTEAARASLNRQGIGHEKLLTVPSPFNTVLWRILVMDTDAGGYYEGFYSLLDGKREIRFVHYPSRTSLLEPVADHWPVRRLQWFTHGFYSVEKEGDSIVFTDLRMGMEPAYVFRFKVAAIEGENIRPKPSRRVASRPRWEQLRWVWQRIWQPDPAAARLYGEPRLAAAAGLGN
jgi:inner membrane protein